jgi:hypothetical protein
MIFVESEVLYFANLTNFLVTDVFVERGVYAHVVKAWAAKKTTLVNPRERHVHLGTTTTNLQYRPARGGKNEK